MGYNNYEDWGLFLNWIFKNCDESVGTYWELSLAGERE